MTKREAIGMFGTASDLARALRITPQAIYQWPDQLQQEQIDRVIGAAIRLGKMTESKTSSDSKVA